MKRSLALMLFLLMGFFLGFPLACNSGLNIPSAAVPGPAPVPCSNCPSQTYTFVNQWGQSGNHPMDRPAGIVLVNGDIFVAQYNSTLPIILEYGSNEGLIRGVGYSGPGQLSETWGLGSDPLGNVYAADSGSDNVFVFNSAGQYLSKFGNNENTYVDAVAVNGTLGRIYVLDESGGQVTVYDMNHKYLFAFGSTGPAAFSDPYNLKIDARGNVYVADYGNGQVVIFDENGNFLGTLVGYLCSPTDVAIDNAGFVYVSDTCNGDIEKYDYQGNLIASFGNFSDVEGLWVDPTGTTVYGADYGNNYVQKYTRTF